MDGIRRASCLASAQCLCVLLPRGTIQFSGGPVWCEVGAIEPGPPGARPLLLLPLCCLFMFCGVKSVRHPSEIARSVLVQSSRQGVESAQNVPANFVST